MKLVTIGVYGSDEKAFFDALQKAAVDTFCDVRRRRGMRRPEYAFANSTRLQKRLAELGIRYVHALEAAPSDRVRAEQAKADEAAHVARRRRTLLTDAFIQGYRRECLGHLDSAKFVKQFGPNARVVALFCVEREP